MTEGTDYRRWLLDRLLDRYERSRHYRELRASRRSVFLPFHRTTFPDYWDDSSAEYRVAIHWAVRELAEAGVVEVRWAKGAAGHQLARIDLDLDRLDEAYRLASRIPRRAWEDRLAATARAWLTRWEQGTLAEMAPWTLEFPRRILSALDGGGRLPARLGSGDASLCDTLCRVLEGLAGLDGELPKRIFSQQVLGDSKAFEGVEGRLIRLLREIWPGAADLEDPAELLADLGLLANPQHVFVSGPVAIEWQGAELDLGRFAPDVGLPAAMIPGLRVLRLDADRVITVENLTPFHAFAATRPPRTLLVYLGGYHNRVRRLWLEKLGEAANGDVTFLHWGDIDLGGFRIFEHLRRRTGLPLRPLLMDRETYLVHAAGGIPFDNGYARQLAALRGRPEYAVFHAVIDEMLRLGRRVEQEAVEPPVQ